MAAPSPKNTSSPIPDNNGERARVCEMHRAFLTLMYAFPLLPGEGAVAEEDEEDEDVIFPLSPRV